MLLLTCWMLKRNNDVRLGRRRGWHEVERWMFRPRNVCVRSIVDQSDSKTLRCDIGSTNPLKIQGISFYTTPMRGYV